MDQRSDHIRQNIESTRAALDDKLDTLETKARQTFDLKHQVSERPLMMVGAAVAAGYVLGSLGGGESDERWHGQPMTTNDYTHYTAQGKPQSSYKQHESSSGGNLLSQFDDEIDMLKTAAIATLTDFLRSTIREYVPAMGQHLDAAARERNDKTPTTSPGGSMSYGTRSSTTNYDGIPQTTSYGSNSVAHRTSAAEGSAGQPAERSIGDTATRS